MLKVIGFSKLIRPLISANLTKLTPIVSTGLAKREIHVTTKKLGGGDHDFIVRFTVTKLKIKA